jgi:hypothetical protein
MSWSGRGIHDAASRSDTDRRPIDPTAVTLFNPGVETGLLTLVMVALGRVVGLGMFWFISRSY